MLSVRTSITSISTRLSGEKPLPKPLYYTQMNPQEQMLHNIIVRLASSPLSPLLSPLSPLSPSSPSQRDSSQGEQKYEYIVDKKGRVHKRFLSYAERQHKQRMFFDSRVGHAIVGDEWMRMKLPSRGEKQV